MHKLILVWMVWVRNRKLSIAVFCACMFFALRWKKLCNYVLGELPWLGWRVCNGTQYVNPTTFGEKNMSDPHREKKSETERKRAMEIIGSAVQLMFSCCLNDFFCIEFRMGLWGITDMNVVMSPPRVNGQTVTVLPMSLLYGLEKLLHCKLHYINTLTFTACTCSHSHHSLSNMCLFLTRFILCWLSVK